MCCVCDLFYAELHKTFAIAWLVLRMGSELRLIYIHYRHTHNPVAPPPPPCHAPWGRNPIMHHKDSSYKLASFRWVYISGPVGDHNRNWLRPRKWAPSGGLCISQTWLRCLVITGRLCQCQPRINKSGILPPSAHTMSSSWCICHSTLKSRCLVLLTPREWRRTPAVLTALFFFCFSEVRIFRLNTKV